ncbi:tetratricopeptide repeat protein [Flavisolibacter nicotianae]|uniref:tetratricopeptide repeat protein n=1 Tax=Flavisolibacter nicotianae TaxID=2364882 RepID=UPI000EB0C0B7|nr:tetratricopeptide repeat protein [Flavisolibacter nicotianae]
MKRNLISVPALLLFAFLTTGSFAQKPVGMSEGSMTWTTKSQQAKKLTAMGIAHIMNVEREQAWQEFQAAIENDPNFSVALAFLANLSQGETRKAFTKRAIESAQNKTEGEKLFASLTDEKATEESRRETWSKLHVLYPNDRAIGHFYAITRATPDERFAAMDEYVKKYPEEASMYNMLGYYYMNDKKDNATAKTYFEKYIQLHPDGPNPYDSMGEFYLNNGDMENAEKYYKMALEKYPFMSSSLEALQKIEAAKKKTDKN